jgi:hypothetical protein
MTARLKWSGSLAAQREYEKALKRHPPRPKAKHKKHRRRKDRGPRREWFFADEKPWRTEVERQAERHLRSIRGE